MPAYEFDASRDMFKNSDMFQRYNVPAGPGEPLASAGLAPDTDLIVIERVGEARAFTVRQMAYYHLAQGVLRTGPFLLTFLPVCHPGVGLSPTIDAELHHFGGGGLFNGLVLLIDGESKTYRDHITGEAVHGPLNGKRLDRMAHGLGVVVGDAARIFPIDDGRDGISLDWDGRRMELTISGQNRMPAARPVDDRQAAHGHHRCRPHGSRHLPSIAGKRLCGQRPRPQFGNCPGHKIV